MSEQTCQCGKPTAGAYLCVRCVNTLEIAIVNVSAYYRDLETLRTKRARYGSGAATKGSIGKAQPLPVDDRFTDRTGEGTRIDWEARNTVSTWVRAVMEEQPELSGPYCRYACLHVSCGAIFRRRFPRHDTVESMCAYLLRQLSYVTRERWAEEILDELTNIERRMRRLVDRPADRWYAGKCSAPTGNAEDSLCDAELFARAEAGAIVCRTCGTEHDVATRREFLLTEAKGYNVTATEAAGALLAWTDYDGSEDKLIDRIRKWEDREKLIPHGHVMHLGKRRSLYRLGDIQELMIRHAQKEQEKRMPRPA